MLLYYFKIVQRKHLMVHHITNKDKSNDAAAADLSKNKTNSKVNKNAKDNRGEVLVKYDSVSKELTSWSGRLKEWYDSETRLLFCSDNRQIRDAWLEVIITLKERLVNKKQ